VLPAPRLPAYGFLLSLSGSVNSVGCKDATSRSPSGGQKDAATVQLRSHMNLWRLM
jgi:hypothetical protein